MHPLFISVLGLTMPRKHQPQEHKVWKGEGEGEGQAAVEDDVLDSIFAPVFINYSTGMVDINRPLRVVTMLWYGMISYVMLWYAMVCYGVLWYAMLWYAMVCSAMLWCAIPCYGMLCYTMVCYAILCSAVLCYGLVC